MFEHVLYPASSTVVVTLTDTLQISSQSLRLTL